MAKKKNSALNKEKDKNYRKHTPPNENQHPEDKELTGHLQEMSPKWRELYKIVMAEAGKNED